MKNFQLQHYNEIIAEVFTVFRNRGEFSLTADPDARLLPLVKLLDEIPQDEHGHTADQLISFVKGNQDIAEAYKIILDERTNLNTK